MLAIRVAAWLTSADMLPQLYDQRCVFRVTLQTIRPNSRALNGWVACVSSAEAEMLRKEAGAAKFQTSPPSTPAA